MSDHYHLLVETPQPNLVAGMRWFQTGCFPAVSAAESHEHVLFDLMRRRGWLV